jgi:hypothetical protein
MAMALALIKQAKNTVGGNLAKAAIPAGRPKGARSKLSESFLKALSEDFATNGIEVIEKVRSSRPHEYLKIVARRCVTVRRWT